jgi:UDP-glucose 4-epimerase
VKVAVVGSKGFIGQHLVSALKLRGYGVVEIDVPKYDITRSDILLPDNPFKGVDAIYHLAAMNLTHCKEDRTGCVRTNIMGTVNVLEAAVKCGVKRIIYASASSVYGNPERMPVHEIDKKKPLTLYGATKLSAEHIIQTYTQTPGFTSVIFRFTNVYGLGQVNGIIPSSISLLKAGKPVIVTGNGEQSRDFVYVDDVVTFLIRALEIPHYSSIFNLGSGINTCINEIIILCASLLGLGNESDLRQEVLKSDRLIKYVMADNGDRKEFIANISRLRYCYGDYRFLLLKDGLKRIIGNGGLNES